MKVTILGSTGSIGVSTLDVIAHHSDRFEVFALTAFSQIELMVQQCTKFTPRYAVMGDEASAHQLRQQLAGLKCSTEVLFGEQSLASVASAAEVDVVMAAIVGGAGLLPTLAAVESGKKVLLANKEALVMAGALFMRAVQMANATLLPIDSEHNAIFQCLPTGYRAGDGPQGVRKLLLTGSGGPFRSWSSTEIKKATPDQACNHPKWSMGRKISVDSATLMNKGLELIEARWLFNLPVSKIEVVIHPESIIHSMVEYLDGSVLAQLGNPDMKIPIAHALAWPERVESGVSPLDIIRTGQLNFESPDIERFPALALAIAAAEQGQGAPTVLNGANEVAVAAFLEGQLRFTEIANCLANVMEKAKLWEPDTIESVLELDSQSRILARQFIAGLSQHAGTQKWSATQ